MILLRRLFSGAGTEAWCVVGLLRPMAHCSGGQAGYRVVPRMEDSPMRSGGILVAACLIAGCSLFVAPPPSSVPLPGPNETPQVGVYYRSGTVCMLPIRIGDAYWTFEASGQPEPPPLPQDEGTTPYPI